ncbi:MAG TPA: ABC transporter substrate-binding protein, partial [Casimicrobiaceae bacterium]|nr:ABC transporter substrate-binding protein [Casimicrobiaceae bacterium]
MRRSATARTWLAWFASAAIALSTPPAGAADHTALHVAFRTAESGFDPQAVSDANSTDLCAAIFDALYTYDYFARPVRLVPNTAAGLPEITDGGRTYTVRVRPGIYFADDPAFKGRRRELIAQDYVYSIKRIFDPRVRSYWLYVFEKRLIGLDPVLEHARKSGAFDYDADIEGLRAVDRYTLRIRFRDPEYGFQHWLASTSLAAVAREVVEAYGDATHRVMEHPVGTGPYRLADWRRTQRVVLEANPGYRAETYPVPDDASPDDVGIARGLAGRRLPLTPRVEVVIVEEAQSRLLAFQRGELDYLEVPTSLAANVLDGDRVRPELASRGVHLQRLIEPSLAFTFFNLDDPVVGGYTPEKIALRRAIGMVFDRRSVVEVLNHGQALPATQVVPPPVPGYDASYVPKDRFDPTAARALLDRFGYKDRDGDGYREMPDGKPLVIVKASTTEATSRASDELWKKRF